MLFVIKNFGNFVIERNIKAFTEKLAQNHELWLNKYGSGVRDVRGGCRGFNPIQDGTF